MKIKIFLLGIFSLRVVCAEASSAYSEEDRLDARASAVRSGEEGLYIRGVMESGREMEERLREEQFAFNASMMASNLDHNAKLLQMKETGLKQQEEAIRKREVALAPVKRSVEHEKQEADRVVRIKKEEEKHAEDDRKEAARLKAAAEADYKKALREKQDAIARLTGISPVNESSEVATANKKCCSIQ